LLQFTQLFLQSGKTIYRGSHHTSMTTSVIVLQSHCIIFTKRLGMSQPFGKYNTMTLDSCGDIKSCHMTRGVNWSKGSQRITQQGSLWH